MLLKRNVHWLMSVTSICSASLSCFWSCWISLSLFSTSFSSVCISWWTLPCSIAVCMSSWNSLSLCTNSSSICSQNHQHIVTACISPSSNSQASIIVIHHFNTDSNYKANTKCFSKCNFSYFTICMCMTFQDFPPLFENFSEI